MKRGQQHAHEVKSFSILLLAAIPGLLHAASVSFDAESATLGHNFRNGTAGAVQYISISTDTVNTEYPGNANRVASYTINSPSVGTYQLYGRVRVGLGWAVDDSFFYGNGFGTKSATPSGDCSRVNNVDVNSGIVNSTYVASVTGTP